MCIRQFVMGGSVTAVYLMLLFLILLFLLIPALNLSGLNASRMHNRISELGCGRLSGRVRTGLLTQILIENLLLMLPGGLVGLLVSYGMVALFQQLLLTPGIIAMVQGSVQTELDSRDAAESGGVRLCFRGLLPAEPDVVDDPCLACDPCEYY